MRREKTKTEMLQDCHEVIIEAGPCDINRLVRVLRDQDGTANARYIRHGLSSSSLAGALRAYGKTLTPRVVCFRQRGGPRLWYVEGDKRINKYVERSKRVRKSAYQPLIDSMHDMLLWFNNPDEDF